MSEKTRGMLLGKFMPPHRGHELLVRFARGMVDELVVLVCSIEREPIEGWRRFAWMQEICGGMDVKVIHVQDEVPQEPAEDPDFWEIWRALVKRYVPERIDYVFASEEYGYRLAEELGARFLPVDLGREQVPISGTAIRNAPLEHWEYLPEAVRPHYVKKVCVFGPESTGKSTLAKKLGVYFQTTVVTEWARDFLRPTQGLCKRGDMSWIGRGQIASEEALSRWANRVLICDTDPLTTYVWSHFLFEECPGWLEEEAKRRRYDLTLLMDVDVPWVDDGERYLSEERSAFMERCVEALEWAGRPYVRIGGGYEERLERAVEEVKKLL